MVSGENLIVWRQGYEIQLEFVSFVLSLRILLYGFRYVCSRYQYKKPFQQAVYTPDGFNSDLVIRIFHFNFSAYRRSKCILEMHVSFWLGSFLQHPTPLCTDFDKN